MDLAKPGLIKAHCSPNALSSCMEYLMDYASPETRQRRREAGGPRTGQRMPGTRRARPPTTWSAAVRPERAGRVCVSVTDRMSAP